MAVTDSVNYDPEAFFVQKLARSLFGENVDREGGMGYTVSVSSRGQPGLTGGDCVQRGGERLVAVG